MSQRRPFTGAFSESFVQSVVKPSTSWAVRGSERWISQKFETLFQFQAATARMLLLIASMLALCLGLSAGFAVTPSGMPDTAMLSAIISILLVSADALCSYAFKSTGSKTPGVQRWRRPQHIFSAGLESQCTPEVKQLTC